jgi:hypothetical protein
MSGLAVIRAEPAEVLAARSYRTDVVRVHVREISWKIFATMALDFE